MFAVEYFYFARVFPIAGMARLKRSVVASVAVVGVVFTADVVFRTSDEL